MSGTLQILSILLLREVEGFRTQLKAYPDDQSVWRVLPGWTNPAGTLVLHTAGNLQHYVGAVLGGSGYVRDRDGEFSQRGLTRRELDGRLQEAASAVSQALSTSSTEEGGGGGEEFLGRPYPLVLPGERRVSNGAMLLHLLSHAAYHLGQVDYHRRGLTGVGELVPVVGLGDVPGM